MVKNRHIFTTMSKIVKFTPSYPLSEFIDYLYLCDSSTPTIEAIAHRQSTHPRILVYKNLNTVNTAELRGLLINATGYFTDQILNMGVCFKPYGLHAGYNISGNALNNRCLAPETFLGAHWKSIAEGIRQGTTIEKLEILHNALYMSLQPRVVLLEIAEIVDELVKADLTKGVQQDLAKAFERTPKSFISLFKNAIGITPLQYLHIHKVEAAKEFLLSEEKVNLTETAYKLGFYDQSHFIRIFKIHTGHSPKAFQKLSKKG